MARERLVVAIATWCRAMQIQRDDPEKVLGEHAHQAWIAMQRVAPLLQERVDQDLKQAGFPDLAAYSILWAIDRAGAPIRPRDLGVLLFLPRYKVSRQIDRLVDDGQVMKRKCPEDARGHLLELTQSGRKLRKDMWEIYRPAIAKVMSGVTEAEAEIVARCLNRLA